MSLIMAAMEPAAGGRDDWASDQVVPKPIYMPQWSPPLVGGMTFTGGVGQIQIYVPQWSPPLVGGMTRDGPGKGRR